ncbi:ATP-dependent helicase [Cellvibrio zantedeschiae]|uniref:DNA 3'-5' helicase n=1 Tax=Cellvibrio zantedeschiae TaxID=1237077 RepID=A0ABQ3AX25_9GAMM|nr:UvrD-helicase domain-containing protein [Cellvibrio zantedeschiae]GGY69962.1 ATP-dependent helicase [Cellvibrio zantedeschiae]
MNQPLDLLARQAALDPTRSFAVSAPAGSGKTGLLTQRLLKLLSLCDNPEEVLAITFTRKAAGEMQDRVLQALWNAKEQPQPSNPHDLLTWQLATNLLAHDSEKNWNLLQCPQRLRIQTIDSLCSAIARQLPIASGFGSQPKPGDDTDAAYRQAVHQLLNELESETSVRDDLTRLLEHLDNNLPALETLLIALLAKRDQWLGLVFQAQHKNARAYLEDVLQNIILDSLSAATKVLQLHASELAGIADWAAGNLQDSAPQTLIAKLRGIAGLPDIDLNDFEQWIAIAELLLTGDGSFRKALNKNQGFPSAKENKESTSYKDRFAEMVAAIVDLHPDAAEVLHELRNLPPAHYDENQWELLDSLTRLLPRLAARLDIVFADTGETDFTAVSQAALTALGYEESPSEIALQLDYRIRHILVDEFQDTASTQLELLQKLTAGWQTGDGRSLFIVGDGMQSCYSFRNANVGIFLEARAQGIGHLPLEKLDLTVNFRSQSGIVNWVNEQFYRAFPVEDDISRGAVKYSPSNAFKPELDGNAVELYLSPFSKADANTDTDDEESTSENRYLAELHEAEAIANLIKELRTNNPDDSVALLARGRNHLQHIFPAMSRLGLSWQATDIDSLSQRMAIIDLTSLTRALLNPADRIAWLAILRAPWCGLDLKDLHAIANTKLENNPIGKTNDFPFIWQQVLCFEDIENISSRGQRALLRFINVIQPALESRQRKPLRQWIEGVWLALGGPATLLDPQDIKDTPTFFALLEQHQQSGSITDWSKFNRAVEKLYAAPRQNADVNLQVMTMHKSKGLEFDHVIIPRLHKLSPGDGQQLMLWRERLSHQGERQLLLGPLAPVGGDKDKLYKYIQKEAALQLDYEATRLFYVGCTRAIKKLYLFATLAQTDDGSWKTPPKKSLLSSIWQSVQNEASTISTGVLKKSNIHEVAFERPGLQQIVALKPEWQLPALVDNELLKLYRGKEVSEEENIPEIETPKAKLARHTGTIIHRALQNLVGTQKSKDISKWITTQEAFWRIQLKQYGWQPEEIALSIKKIVRAINNTLNDKRGQWILDNSHLQSACELAITYKQGDKIDLKLRENIIDRTFIANGTRWIIDYKSSEPTEGQTTADFITQEILAYRTQLLRYKNCFTALGENEIKMGFYFPLLENTERFVEIDI